MIRKIRKHFLKLFIAWVVLTTAMVFFALRSEYVADKAHHYLLNFLEERLQSKVEMRRPEIGWIRGSWYIKDVSIRPNYGKEKTAIVAAKSVRISFFPWFNVLKREIGISFIQLEEPSVYLRIEKGKIANLPSLDFLKGPKGFFRFALREVRISKGIMAVSYPERPMEITFSDIDMKVRPDVDKKQYGFILANSSADIKVKEFTQKIISMKGDFRVTPDNLTIIKSTFHLPEGNVSAEGLYLKFATAEWVTKLSSELSLDAVRSAAIGQWPAVSEKVKDLKGNVNLSAVINGNRDGFDVKGEAKAEEIELDGLKINDTSTDFSTKGQWNSLKESSFGIDFRSKMPVELVNRYVEKSPRLKGTADIRVMCSVSAGQWGEAEKIKFKGDVTSPRLEVAGMPVNKVLARFNADSEAARIEELAADMLGGRLKGTFGLDLKGDKKFGGSVAITGMELSDLVKLRPLTTEKRILATGKVSGDIDIAGAFEPELIFVATPSLQVEGLTVSYGGASSPKIKTTLNQNIGSLTPSAPMKILNIIPIPTSSIPGGKGEITMINARISYDGKVTRFESLGIETPASTVSASGDLVGGRLSLSLDLKSTDLREFGGYVSGTGIVKGKVTGPISGPAVEGSLILSNLSWGKYQADTFSGYIRFKEMVLTTTGLKVARGGSSVSFQGEVSLKEETPRLDAIIELKKGRLEEIASFAGIDARSTGEVSARGKVKGGLRSLDGDIDIKAAKMSIVGEDIDTINVKGRLQGGRLFIDKAEALRDGERVTVDGEISPEGDASLRISSTPLSIENLSALKKAGIPLEGSLLLRGEVSGNIKNPFFKGMASLKDFRYKNIDIGGGNLSLSFSGMRLTAAGSAFGSEITGNLLFQGNKPFHINLSTTDLSINPYLKGIDKLEGVTGSVSGTLDAEGELSNLKGSSAKGSLSKLQLVRDPFFVKNTKDIEIELRDGRIIFRTFQLSGKGTELDTSGWIGINGETSLLVNGRLDLYLLQIFTRIIDKGEGAADIRLAISGSPPRIEGKVIVNDGVIGFKGFEPLFTGISAAMTMSGDSLILETLTGRVGDGNIKGDGSIKMAGLGLKRTDISFDLSGIHLPYPKWVPSEVEGNLRLTGDYPSLLLSGDINVLNARYSEKIDWKTFLPSFRRRLQEPAAFKEGEGVLRLDINFRADRNLIFENNAGRGELKGEVRLKGDTSRFGIVGEVEVISGKVFYKEHEFTITSGIIEFPDPKKVEPVFDFIAEGKVRDNVEGKDYDIQIMVQGNINDFKVTMISSPFLAELDIASLISLGVTSKSLQETGGGAPAYGAASFLTREVEDKFKDYIGFERFHIDPYYSKVTGSTEPKLTVGKELTEDTAVIYSRGLSGTGEQEVQMEYKLYRNFSLIGGWSSFGASGEGNMGADMKFRFEFR